MPKPKTKHEVYLICEERGENVVLFRLLAEKLPIAARNVTVGLATGSADGCQTPVTELYTHDAHAAGPGNKEEYIQRVVRGIKKGLEGIEWDKPELTGYRMIKIIVDKAAKPVVAKPIVKPKKYKHSQLRQQMSL